MAATMIPPVAGNILIGALNVVGDKQQVKPLIGYMPQRFGLYQDLTVDENMVFFMDVFNVPRKERARRRERYLGFSNLLPFVDRPAGNLSGGMKQKLGLACVLVHEPKVLILDEPTNGVDPVSRQEFWEILAQMRADGMTIMVSTAYLDEGEKCDRLALMHRSRILDIATPQEIRGRYASLEEAMIKRIQEVDKEIVHDSFKR
jgi:ABC-2 type transport system ATP-binding protein